MNIVIIGLPGSGKTKLMDKYENFLKFDDYISNLYDGKLFKALKSGANICACDPRLCDPSKFNKFVDKIFAKNNTKLILFENTIDMCLKNANNRNNTENPRNVEKNIINLSHLYDLNFYKNWDYEIVSVYDPNNAIN